MIAEIKKEEKNIIYCLITTLLNIKIQVICIKNYVRQKVKKNEDQVYSIKEILDQIKKSNKSAKEYVIKKNENIINIVERILYFNQLEQQGLGLKILTPNQMLSRLPITLAQLKAGNNSEKLKNEIRQLLYSLYRSKKLTKQLYKSLIDII